jgi:hypothetical protein
MAQKKAKKSKIEKPKKAIKAAPKKAAASAAPKKAKPNGAKKGAAASAKKKPALKEAKKAVSAKAAKPAKAPKAEKKPLKEAKKAAPAKASPVKAAKEAKKVAKEKPAKGKAAAAAPAGKGAGKKKGEIVLEMPAPKGVALLGREKKKTKAEIAALNRKNRCREPGCEHETLLSGFCRLHYIKNWRKIKRKEAILASGQLNNYVEELVSKYPDKYLDVIRQDLASEKEWAKVVIDLELESADEEGSADEDLEGVAEGTGRREREFDDDSDTF